MNEAQDDLGNKNNLLDYITEKAQAYFKIQNGLSRALFLYTSLCPDSPLGTAFIRVVSLLVEIRLYYYKAHTWTLLYLE